jgi:hypothetical protein
MLTIATITFPTNSSAFTLLRVPLFSEENIQSPVTYFVYLMFSDILIHIIFKLSLKYCFLTNLTLLCVYSKRKELLCRNPMFLEKASLKTVTDPLPRT